MSLFDLSAFVTKKIKCSAVIVAGGSSTRFGSDKLFAPLCGIPVLAYSLTTFENCEYISEIVVVTESEKIAQVAELCDRFGISKVTKVVCGGESRLESALSGVSETDKKSDLIAVHDGARPLVTSKIIEDAIKGAYKYKAAVPAIPARDTVKILSGSFTSETPDRASTFCAQTPQVFIPELVKGALTSALQKGTAVSDDASAVEMLGFSVFVTEGSEENIKITTPLDLKFAECILAERRGRAST
ncbi:MAG: 2-C-methyl-D-erythritol 4-phosphate cytidylyltransferase [Oscillospiraceae bacterium]